MTFNINPFIEGEIFATLISIPFMILFYKKFLPWYREKLRKARYGQ